MTVRRVPEDGMERVESDWLVEGLGLAHCYVSTEQMTAFAEVLRPSESAPSGLPGAVPLGGIIMWSGSVTSIPSGWALCDGQSGHPDLRGRFIRGAQASVTPGGVGGADEITLAVGQLPAHDHGFTTSQAGLHTLS